MSNDTGPNYQAIEELEDSPLGGLFGGDDLEKAAKDVQEEIKREKRELQVNKDILNNLDQVVSDFRELEPAIEEALKIEKFEDAIPNKEVGGWGDYMENQQAVQNVEQHFRKIMQITGADNKANALRVLNKEVEDVAKRLDQVIHDLKDEEKLFQQEQKEEADLEQHVQSLENEHLRKIAKVERKLEQIS
jgi:hypothetical protein